MTVPDVAHPGNLFPAPSFRHGAPGVKPAAVRWIDGAGDIPFQNHPTPFGGGVRKRYGGQQRLGVRVLRRGKEPLLLGYFD